MHLMDGIIPLWQAAVYWIITITTIAIYLFKLSKTDDKERKVVYTAIFTAAAIAASSISIPSPFGVSMHFFLIPLVAIILGPLSAIAVAFLCLIVQFLLLGMGGATVLGANTVTIGVALSLSTYIFYKLISELDNRLSVFAGTFMGIIIATIVQVLILLWAGVANLEMLMLTLIPFYMFIAVIEGIANVFIVSFISKVKPDLLKLEKI
ncbi:MAG: energy-coupling factor ABC transporter permease [Methanobacteriaceae archaeon]|nr:energy-coupling factor ABC transporter permease [Methanobacteriaceae archaeon]